MGELRIQFNLWHGALGVYAGIEAPDEVALTAFLARIGISINSCSALDGVDLFNMFAISLDRCQFQIDEPTPSVAEFILRVVTK